MASFVSKLSDTVSSEIGKVRKCPLTFCSWPAAPSRGVPHHSLLSWQGTAVQAYGKRAFLITTFKEVPRGTEGAVSLEGTAAGMLAALGFAGLSLVLGQVGFRV